MPGIVEQERTARCRRRQARTIKAIRTRSSATSIEEQTAAALRRLRALRYGKTAWLLLKSLSKSSMRATANAVSSSVPDTAFGAEPPIGLEPTTYSLRNYCSTN